MQPEILDELLRSKSFREWSPIPTTKPSAITAGRGRSFLYRGKRYTNLVVNEKHFKPVELARAWGVDVETIRNVFRDEPGVVKIGDKNPKHKRPYLTLRIPESVAVRVHRRLSE